MSADQQAQQTTKNPLYGRKWRIVVNSSDGKTAWDVSDSDFENATPDRAALRCTFRIEKSGYQCPWWADISIWNLRGDTQEAIIREGYSVTVEAGYVNGAYGKIFEGEVFQPLFDRQNVTDFVTTLHCIDGMGLMHANFASLTMAAGYDYNSMLAQMAKQAHTPIPLGEITPNLDKKKAPRGMTFMGDTKQKIRQITQDNNAQSWYGDGKLHISKLADEYKGKALVFTPETGLIGTPQQIDNGVSFRTLLHPDLKITQPQMVVKLDMSIIRQMKVNPPSLPSSLDQDGEYKVIQVTHSGDTRGNDWYSDVVGINMVGNVPALLYQATVDPS